MARSRSRYAVRRGATMAVAAFAVAFGLASLTLPTPPNWPLLVAIPLLVGAAYAVALHVEAGPLSASA